MKLSGAGDAPMKWGVVIAMSATNFTQARAAGRARQATPRKAGLDSNVDHAHVDANVDPAPPPCRLARPAPPQGVFFTLPFAVAVFMVRGWEAQNGGAGEVFASAGALTGILVGWHLPGHQWPSRRMGVLRCTGPACCISRLASWQHRPPRAASRRRRLWVAQQLGQAGRQRCNALLPPPPLPPTSATPPLHRLQAGCYSFAQCTTQYAWGAFSDKYGRKPVMLIASGSLVVSAVWFGFAGSFAQAAGARVLGGLLNGVPG